MKYRAFKYISIATILIGFGILALVTYWLLHPHKTIEFKSDYRTEKQVYVQGENTVYSIDYCKYTDVMPKVTKKFVDGIEFTAEANKAVLRKGCHIELVDLKIPDTLPAGTYRLVVILEYKVNPLKTIRIEHKSNWFKVLNKIEELK